jgi:hypothetical protein
MSRTLRVKFVNDGAKGFSVDEMLYEELLLDEIIQKNVADEPFSYG